MKQKQPTPIFGDPGLGYYALMGCSEMLVCTKTAVVEFTKALTLDACKKAKVAAEEEAQRMADEERAKAKLVTILSAQATQQQ